jgi:hypothetical protein
MYITLGTLFRRPELQNLRTEGMTDSDMEFVDYFSAFIPRGNKLLHVIASEKA